MVWANTNGEHSWEPLKQVLHCDATFDIMETWVADNCPFRISRVTGSRVPVLTYNGARICSAEELAGDRDIVCVCTRVLLDVYNHCSCFHSAC